jgi:hypothetical protein
MSKALNRSNIGWVNYFELADMKKLAETLDEMDQAKIAHVYLEAVA